ncbi:MAG: YdeI/OmpD-associated family protein [Longimicrobiales bacterium]
MLALIERGALKPAGLAEVERAQTDGRWDDAYDSPRRMTVPEDLETALAENRPAQSFFQTLDGRNRYAILFRIQTARKAEKRARRIQQFVQMLARKEKLHP